MKNLEETFGPDFETTASFFEKEENGNFSVPVPRGTFLSHLIQF